MIKIVMVIMREFLKFVLKVKNYMRKFRELLFNINGI